MKKIYLYPLWLRLWHWFNALLFLVLILSGISLHYSDKNALIVPFDVSISSHNISGILLSFIYLFYIIFNISTGNIKHYIPQLKGFYKKLLIQAKYYMLGIFNNEPHPFHSSVKHKFNPMQQVTYATIMFVLMPGIIISCWLMLFPEIAPNEIFSMGGVWPMAILHIILGFFLSVFMLGHIYLASTGKTVGELLTSMLNGWHLHEEDEVEISQETLQAYKPFKKKLLPVVFYNPLTMTGSLISLISMVLILFLMMLEFFSDNTKAYIGIITFVVLPSLLMFGIILIIFGAFKENRRLLQKESSEKKLPIIDLNNAKHQVAIIFFTVGSVILITFSIIGSFKAYEYTDSDDFCGNICHQVMEPEYTAYQASPHSRVGCVKCHIGSGADWFVKAKISGLYQVYSVFMHKFSRPIPTPVENLRPAAQTCEQCHWPKHFYSEKKINLDFYTSDENNTEYQVTMNIKTGGGSSELGNSTGIHYSMNISNEITYLATDRERMVIPWVKARNRETGKETIYRSTEAKFSDDLLKPQNLRIMDCIDCHNRPSHIYHQPNRTVNTYMSLNKIDKTLPYIKNLSVQAMEGHANSTETAYKDMRAFILEFYAASYPDVLKNKKVEIEKSIGAVYDIYKRNYFPYMGANWKRYPNNIGHMYSAGCYRCHDGKHVSPEGKVISKDCNVCHAVASQKAPGFTNTANNYGEINFIHPGGIDKLIKVKNCPECHGVKK